MVELYFVTALVLTTKVPATGWVQYTRSFTDQKVCEQVIVDSYEKITAALKYHIGGDFRSVQEMRCVTYNDALQMNIKIGH